MRYMLLIYTDESARAETTPDEAAAATRRWMDYTKTLDDRGILISGEALEPVATATTLRERDGRTLVTDGPFAETREQLGGFYMLDCDGLDTVLELAGRMPNIGSNSVEIRPIMELG